MSEKPLPEEVVLCAIGYRIQESEGLIVFTTNINVWGCYNRIAFEKKEMCWYVSIKSTSDNSVMVEHILQAYKLVCEYKGGNFEGASVRQEGQ